MNMRFVESSHYTQTHTHVVWKGFVWVTSACVSRVYVQLHIWPLHKRNLNHLLFPPLHQPRSLRNSKREMELGRELCHCVALSKASKTVLNSPTALGIVVTSCCSVYKYFKRAQVCAREEIFSFFFVVLYLWRCKHVGYHLFCVVSYQWYDFLTFFLLRFLFCFGILFVVSLRKLIANCASLFFNRGIFSLKFPFGL